MAQPFSSRPASNAGREQLLDEEHARGLADAALPTSAAPAPYADASIHGDDSCDPCLRESLRLEANKLAATRMLQMFDNPILALREYKRFVRDLNISINVHNAVCKPHRVQPLST